MPRAGDDGDFATRPGRQGLLPVHAAGAARPPGPGRLQDGQADCARPDPGYGRCGRECGAFPEVSAGEAAHSAGRQDEALVGLHLLPEARAEHSQRLCAGAEEFAGVQADQLRRQPVPVPQPGRISQAGSR